MASADVVRDMAETLAHLLRAGSTGVQADRVLLSTPDEFAQLRNPGQPTITIFLYRIGVDPQMRNLPRRTMPDGRTTRQLLPLELSFLITAWANKTEGELQIIGRILQILYDRAELGPADLQGESWEKDDTVQLILETLPLEDHYRIWDASDVPYRLSLTYMARVIGIQPTEVVATPPVVEGHIGRRSP